jgi:hypothetical protein
MKNVKMAWVAGPAVLLILLVLVWIFSDDHRWSGAPHDRPRETAQDPSPEVEPLPPEVDEEPERREPVPDSPTAVGENAPTSDQRKAVVVQVEVGALGGSEIDLYTLFFYTEKECNKMVHSPPGEGEEKLDADGDGRPERREGPLRFPAPGPGPAILVAFSAGFSPSIVKAILVPGINVVSLTMQAGGFVEGTVVDSASKPAAQAKVSLVLDLPALPGGGGPDEVSEVTLEGVMVGFKSVLEEGVERRVPLSRKIRYVFSPGELQLVLAAEPNGRFWFGDVPNSGLKLRYAYNPVEGAPDVPAQEQMVVPDQEGVRLVLPGVLFHPER